MSFKPNKKKRCKICGKLIKEINSYGQKYHKKCWLIKRKVDRRLAGKIYYQKYKKRINTRTKEYEQKPKIKKRRKEQKRIYYLKNK